MKSACKYAGTFNVCNVLKFGLTAVGGEPELARMLRLYTADPGSIPDFELEMCANRACMPGDGVKAFSGRYKGVGWQAAIRDQASGVCRKIWFCSPGFSLDFLAIRMVFFPVLKEHLLGLGGLVTLGAVVRKKGVTLFLFGLPGAGKTRIALKAVEAGWDYVADYQVAVLPSGAVLPIFDEMEVRYATIRHSRFWDVLTAAQRTRLHFCRIVSGLTNRRISFGLSMRPEEIGIRRTQIQTGDRLVFVALNNEGRTGPMSVQEITDALVLQEQDYQGTYGTQFFVDRGATTELLSRNSRKVFDAKQGWYAAGDSDISTIEAMIQ